VTEPTAHTQRRTSAQVAVFVLLDVAVIWVSTLLAYWARFGGTVTGEFVGNVAVVAAIASVVFPALNLVFGLYHQVWRYASIDVALKLAAATAIGLALLAAGTVFITSPGELRPVPLGVLLILSTFQFIGSAFVRVFGRFSAYMQAQAGSGGKRVLIVGAGDAGSLLLRDIENQPDLGLRVLGFVDDDAAKRRRMIRGVRVLGPVDSLHEFVAELDIDEVMVAVPSASDEERRHILDACTRAEVETRIVQSLAAVSGDLSIADLRTVSIEDLLGREPVPVDVEQIAETITGKVIAVTGAAGSIGSELCRQVLKLRPRRIVLIDIDESRLYETFLEFTRLAPGVPEMVICDVRDPGKTQRVMSAHRPDMLLHAAAYKHVPLMELAPDEAVKANVLGTRNIIEACEANGVGTFVLISTDKAVVPRSIMGLTKAIAEMLTVEAARRGRVRTCAVRFGNVLGSRGSVVPLFEEQLRSGGPILVTHPEATRYFMTIPEAARLVLQAQAISEGGDIFVLEMGEPVRILDLARKMIALSGARTTIEFVGLRPAEKMHETLVHDDIELIPTGREKVLVAGAVPLPGPPFASAIDDLIDSADRDDRQELKRCLRAIVPSFEGDGDNA
jgi:FlaA1/EpsC-like NDP-sugar epimerase